MRAFTSCLIVGIAATVSAQTPDLTDWSTGSVRLEADFAFDRQNVDRCSKGCSDA